MNQNHIPVKVTPENLPELFYRDQAVVSTDMLATLYGTENVRISQNYAKNSERFSKSKHYFKLDGTDLKDFKNCLAQSYSVSIPLHTRNLFLWTERGAARHAKMLNTGQAWDVFEKLEDAYFNRSPYGVVKGMGPAAKEQKLARIATTLTNAKKIAKCAGLSGNDAILKANELTVDTIGIDVFNLLGINPPKATLHQEEYPDEAKSFFETLDQLLTSGKVHDHGDKVEIVWIHMPTALETIEQHLGRSFDRSVLYYQIKMSDRYVEQKNAKRSRIFKKPIHAWALHKFPQQKMS